MTEYWKSQPKKFCDFCKCWLTDNKPSISFHENGKKHKENVEIRIKEVRKKGTTVRKDEEELKKNLQAIEAAALEAYEKDIGTEVSSAVAVTTSCSTYQRPSTPAPCTSTTNSQALETGCSISYTDGQPVVRCTHNWVISQSSEGYYYYYNSQTLTTQWDVPQCLQTSSDEIKEPPPVNTIEKEDIAYEIMDRPKAECKPDQKDSEKNNEEVLASYSPYGAWTSVRTIEAPPTSESFPEQNTPEEQVATEKPEVTARNTEKKFKERDTPKMSYPKTDQEVVSFKKRKLNSEKKRKIRKTT